MSLLLRGVTPLKAAGGGGSCKEAAEQHQRNPRARGTCQQPRAAIRARRRAACYTRPAGFRLQQHPVRQRDSTPPTPWSPTAQNSLALESSVISHTNNKTNGCGYEHGQYSTDDVTTTTTKLQATSAASSNDDATRCLLLRAQLDAALCRRYCEGLHL